MTRWQIQEKNFYSLAILFQPLLISLIAMGLMRVSFFKENLDFILMPLLLSIYAYPLYLLIAALGIFLIRKTSQAKRKLIVWTAPLIIGFIFDIGIRGVGWYAIQVGYINVIIFLYLFVMGRKLNWIIPDYSEVSTS